MMSFQNDQSVKMLNLIPLTEFVFFFALACERIFFETHSIKSRCYRTGKYTVCRRVRASFSPEIVQAGAVEGGNETSGERWVATGLQMIVNNNNDTSDASTLRFKARNNTNMKKYTYCASR